MAKPRIFISSTFYDLWQVREDLERFIRELGYEAVRHETGNIPYGKEQPLESYVYREVDLCDILVTIIGGKFGTESHNEQGYSITQKEIKRALERGIQVFIFIEQNVHSEYSTFKLNKDNKKVKYQYVDDTKVYEFIDSLYQLPKNNPITPFQTSADIVNYLKSQWAGLFQRFLQEQMRIAEFKTLEEMKNISNTLKQLVNFLTEERKSSDYAIKNILLANHPAFKRFQSLTNTKYRVFFSNLSELNDWLIAQGWEPMRNDFYFEESILEWAQTNSALILSLKNKIFDDENRLKIYTNDDWDDEWVDLYNTDEGFPDVEFGI